MSSPLTAAPIQPPTVIAHTCANCPVCPKFKLPSCFEFSPATTCRCALHTLIRTQCTSWRSCPSCEGFKFPDAGALLSCTCRNTSHALPVVHHCDTVSALPQEGMRRARFICAGGQIGYLNCGKPP